MKTATDILVTLIVGAELTFKMAIITAIIGALMLIPYRAYKHNGGKKTYFKYCSMVVHRLFNLANKGIEHIFTA